MWPFGKKTGPSVADMIPKSVCEKSDSCYAW